MIAFSEFDYHIFIDESGCLGFNEGSSDYFVITAVCTKTPNALKKRIKKQKAILINKGWPKDKEIKGNGLWNAWRKSYAPDCIKNNKEEVINNLLDGIIFSPQKIFYAVIKKSYVSQYLKDQPYGILYNYYTGKLLERACCHFPGMTRFVIDQRSKEAHLKTKFDGYIETHLAIESNFPHHIEIIHSDSEAVPGLQVVDFYSWSIFRHYEHNDSQFFNKIRPKIEFEDKWGVR